MCWRNCRPRMRHHPRNGRCCWPPCLNWTACSTACRPPVKRAFLLPQLDELPQEDIARQLGISLATVKRHLRRAGNATQAWQQLQMQHEHLPPAAHASLLRACVQANAPRRHAVKTLALLLACGASLYAFERRSPWRGWTADYRTTVNQRRVVTLADGTQLTLNTNSAVNIAYSGAQRRIQLLAGEIFIATGKDAAQRPFFVGTPHGRLQALGAHFDGTGVHCQALAPYGGAWLDGMPAAPRAWP